LGEEEKCETCDAAVALSLVFQFCKSIPQIDCERLKKDFLDGKIGLEQVFDVIEPATAGPAREALLKVKETIFSQAKKRDDA